MINDNYWQLLTTIDNYWQLLTTIDNYWLLLTTIDNYWQQLTTMTEKGRNESIKIESLLRTTFNSKCLSSLVACSSVFPETLVCSRSDTPVCPDTPVYLDTPVCPDTPVYPDAPACLINFWTLLETFLQLFMQYFLLINILNIFTFIFQSIWMLFWYPLISNEFVSPIQFSPGEWWILVKLNWIFNIIMSMFILENNRKLLIGGPGFSKG